MGLLATVGGIASILGAVLAWKSEARAKEAADAAEEVRDELQTRAVQSDLIRVAEAERRALSSLAKYGPGAVSNALTGADFSTEAQSVREYLEGLKRNRTEFGLTESNPADNLCEEAYELLDRASKAQERGPVMKELYLLLHSFSYRLKLKVGDYEAGRVLARGARRVPR